MGQLPQTLDSNPAVATAIAAENKI